MVTKTAINMVEVDMNDLNKCEVNISIMYNFETAQKFSSIILD